MAAPSVTQVSHGAASSGTSASATAPSRRVAGDVLFAALYIANGGASTSRHDATGWTVVSGAAVARGADFEIVVLTRVASGDAADNITTTWTGSAAYALVSVLLAPGAATTGTIDVVGSANTGTSRAPLARSVTTTVAETLLIWLVGTSNPTTPTPPSGFTDHSGGGCGIGSAAQLAAGASGDKTGALNITNAWAAVMVAIAPAAVVPPVASPRRMLLLGVG